MDRTYASVYTPGTVAIERVKLGKHHFHLLVREQQVGDLEEYNAIEVLIKQGMPHAELRQDSTTDFNRQADIERRKELQLEQEQEGARNEMESNR